MGGKLGVWCLVLSGDVIYDQGESFSRLKFALDEDCSFFLDFEGFSKDQDHFLKIKAHFDYHGSDFLRSWWAHFLKVIGRAF